MIETANLSSMVFLLIASSVTVVPSSLNSFIDSCLASMSEGYGEYEIVGIYSTDSHANGQSQLTLSLLKPTVIEHTF